MPLTTKKQIKRRHFSFQPEQITKKHWSTKTNSQNIRLRGSIPNIQSMKIWKIKQFNFNFTSVNIFFFSVFLYLSSFIFLEWTIDGLRNETQNINVFIKRASFSDSTLVQWLIKLSSQSVGTIIKIYNQREFQLFATIFFGYKNLNSQWLHTVNCLK